MNFKIREARKQCNMTQADLAAKLGLDGVTLSGYENGKHDPKSATLAKIAHICGVSVDYLLGREQSPTDNISAEALAVARAYDRMSAYGRAIVDAVVQQERAQRPQQPFRAVKVVGTALQDGTLETRHAARRELQEAVEDAAEQAAAKY